MEKDIDYDACIPTTLTVKICTCAMEELEELAKKHDYSIDVYLSQLIDREYFNERY